MIFLFNQEKSSFLELIPQLILEKEPTTKKNEKKMSLSFNLASIKNTLDEVRAQYYPKNETEKKVGNILMLISTSWTVLISEMIR